MNEPSSLGSVLGKVVHEVGGAEGRTLLRVRRAWAEAVGELSAAHSRPTSLRKGVLRVAVDHAVWAQELKLLEPRIREALRGRLGADVERIKFWVDDKVGPPDEPIREAAPVAADESAGPPGLDGPSDRALARVTDPDLRSSLTSILRKVKAREGR